MRSFLSLMLLAASALILLASSTNAAAGTTAAATTTSASSSILFVSCWQKSGVLAIQGLAEEMQQRGHTVYFTALEQDKSFVTSLSSGIKWISGGSYPTADEDFKYAHEITDLFEGEAAVGKMLVKNVVPYVRENKIPIELVAFDPLCIAGEAIAHQLNVTSVMVAPHRLSLTFLGSEFVEGLFVPMIISGHTATQLLTSLPAIMKNTVMGFVARYVLPFVRGMFHASFRSETGLPSQYLESQTPYGNTKLAIIGGMDVFEYPRALYPLTQVTGPFLPRKFTKLEQDVEKKELNAWMTSHSCANFVIALNIAETLS